MKRFLISMVVAITFITIGFTTLFFEIPSFEIVEVNEESKMTKTFQVEDLIDNDEIDIEVDNSYVYVRIEDDLKNDDEIEIEYSKNIQMEEKRTKLVFEGYSDHSYSRFRDAIEDFVEGLKEKKIYVNYDRYDNEVIIHCSPSNRKYINVKYD